VNLIACVTIGVIFLLERIKMAGGWGNKMGAVQRDSSLGPFHLWWIIVSRKMRDGQQVFRANVVSHAVRDSTGKDNSKKRKPEVIHNGIC